MDADGILRYLEMQDHELRRILGGSRPPLEALLASAVLDFMQAYHLSDRRDAIRQFTTLRAAQADLLALSQEERARFLDGLSLAGE